MNRPRLDQSATIGADLDSTVSGTRRGTRLQRLVDVVTQGDGELRRRRQARVTPGTGATAISVPTISSSVAPAARATWVAHWYVTGGAPRTTTAARRTRAHVFAFSPESRLPRTEHRAAVPRRSRRSTPGLEACAPVPPPRVPSPGLRCPQLLLRHDRATLASPRRHETADSAQIWASSRPSSRARSTASPRVETPSFRYAEIACDLTV